MLAILLLFSVDLRNGRRKLPFALRCGDCWGLGEESLHGSRCPLSGPFLLTGVWDSGPFSKSSVLE